MEKLTGYTINEMLVIQKPFKCVVEGKSFCDSMDFVDHVLEEHFPKQKISLWDKCQLSREVKEKDVD